MDGVYRDTLSPWEGRLLSPTRPRHRNIVGVSGCARHRHIADAAMSNRDKLSRSNEKNGFIFLTRCAI